ncbi:hypothetical protein AAMO2058_001683700 [Amorphochlora amoebiformis]
MAEAASKVERKPANATSETIQIDFPTTHLDPGGILQYRLRFSRRPFDSFAADKSRKFRKYFQYKASVDILDRSGHVLAANAQTQWFYRWPFERVIQFKVSPRPENLMKSLIHSIYPDTIFRIHGLGSLSERAVHNAMSGLVIHAKLHNLTMFWSPVEVNPLSEMRVGGYHVAHLDPRYFDTVKPSRLDLYIRHVSTVVLVPSTRMDNVFLQLKDYMSLKSPHPGVDDESIKSLVPVRDRTPATSEATIKPKRLSLEAWPRRLMPIQHVTHQLPVPELLDQLFSLD